MTVSRLIRRARAALLLLAGAFAPSAPSPAAAPDEEPLAVLFLGDRGHHQPAARAAQLIPVMATRGVKITYTEDLSDLNPATLAQYDALMIYANTEQIEPEQEKALLDYVEGGGGFAPIHCASYCFLNSPKYIALVGAQFKSHGTGEFDVKDVAPTDPILKGLDPVPDLGRDVHPHQVQRDRPPPAAGPRREGEGRALDLDPDAGQGPRLLHRLRPRPPDLGPPRLP